MNKEDIIRMAREAGIANSWDLNWQDKIIERFAKLVAQHEREAIAQMVEDAPPLMEFAQNHQGGCLMCGFTPKQAAEVIRARGQA